MLLVVAVVAALAAAVCYGVSAVLEQVSVHRVAERGVFAPRLLVDLAHQPVWLASIGATVAGAGLQAVALHWGPLALVQPIVVCDLLVAVLVGSRVRGVAPDGVMVAGAGCCCAGVGVFLAVAQPGGGVESVSAGVVVPLAAALGAVLAGCLVWAKRGPRAVRPLALALACGVCYGVNAFLLKLVTFSLGQGFAAPLEQWPLYALAVVGPVGFLLNQQAFQSGTLIGPALAVITTVTSRVSIGIGWLWLHETIAARPGQLAAEATALAAMTAGIVLLAHRAPAVARQPARRLTSLPGVPAGSAGPAQRGAVRR